MEGYKKWKVSTFVVWSAKKKRFKNVPPATNAENYKYYFLLENIMTNIQSPP